MKNNILKICAFLILVSCNETLEEPSIKKEKLKVLNEQATTNHKKNINGRTPGDGSGEPGSGSYGSGLTWNGDGRWHGNFAGSPVWFWGPSPTQLQNGIRGDWDVACAYYTPNVCYPDGFTVTGNGAGFTVSQPACGGNGTTTIQMPRITADVGVTDGNKIIYFNRIWSTETRTIRTFSSGTCKLFAQGKVIVNENCQPVIVSPTSTYPINLCGESGWVE